MENRENPPQDDDTFTRDSPTDADRAHTTQSLAFVDASNAETRII